MKKFPIEEKICALMRKEEIPLNEGLASLANLLIMVSIDVGYSKDDVLRIMGEAWDGFEKNNSLSGGWKH